MLLPSTALLLLGFLSALLTGSESAAQRPGQAAPAAVISGPPAGQDMDLAFADEFNGTSLDLAKWITVYDKRGVKDSGIAKRSLPGNGELQVYFDREYLGLGIDPFVVRDGRLRIVARPLDERARARVMADLDRRPPPGGVEVLRKAAYSSGVISTRGGFTQKYGYFEVRARWSQGRGLWPAFWLLPFDGSWPPEVDVIEGHGDKTGLVYHSVHTRGVPKSVTREGAVPGSTTDYHTYGVLWLPDRLDYYIDGRHTATIPAPPDLTKEVYVVANLAVGGFWPGFPDQSVVFPATLDIDHIRVWRHRAAPAVR